ncbi:head-tail adaptor protein [Sphingomonas sp. SRS2]|uniref:head-tail adaptor protein n=1 Tax=Sphingomonas sp. SRS2 TaxID=133190 RepID=UPI0006183F1C|nr:head-tail adaptor protein [Sphingomonas sp. SRS2]KKC24928.1 hypothetical protein WP12_17065 [Sphingomonas sp. SRS2]
MQAGKYNRRIAIYRPVPVSDGVGGQTEDWRLIGHRRVRGRPVGGSQSDVSGMLADQQSWRIEMRKMDIRTGYRVVLDGARYRVRSAVDPDGGRRDLVVLIDMELPE